MGLTKEYLEELVNISDPDGVWAMMQDLEMWEEAEYIEEKYFNNNETNNN